MIDDEARSIDRLIGEMTLAEKVGQMTQVANHSISPTEVADFAIGSVLSGGDGNPSPNTAEAWFDMVHSFLEASGESRLGVPLIYGADAVHGHSHVPGATVFPHNIGLGAAGDADLVERIGRATRTELLATGIRWTFAPTVAVPQDIRWGRTYEGYGRDPALVSELGSALVSGLQDPWEDLPSVLACPKHFVADGGTAWGSVVPPDWVDWWDGWGDSWQIDQGDASLSERDLRAVHLPPYETSLAAGAATVMASYSSWNGEKLHGHRQLLTDVLKGELGFGGYVVSDWMAVQQLDPSFDISVVTAINAGVDMVMVPFDFQRFIETTLRAVADGLITEQRIDDAAARILGVKASIGLLADHGAVEAPSLSVLGRKDHRELAAEAARRGAVLLKNQGLLPLRPAPRVLAVGGAAADDVGLQCGGWTIGWQGAAGPITAGTTLVEALHRALPGVVSYDPDGGEPSDHVEVGIVCIAEVPYAEGPGDRAVPTASAADREVFARMRARCDRLVLVVYSGRPLVIPELIADSDAVIAAWLPGSEMTQFPMLLLGDAPFEGRLPQPWPVSERDLEAHAAARQAAGVLPPRPGGRPE